MTDPKQITTTDDKLQYAVTRNNDIGGSRWIDYRGLMIMAPVRDILQAINSLNRGDRRKIMASVSASLARDFPKVEKGKATHKIAMRCAQDIAIWYANEVIERRATLELS